MCARGRCGKPGVIVTVQREPGANVVATGDRLMAALPQLRDALPASVDLEILNDRTRTIRASLHEVELTLMIAIILVIGVMALFLRQLAATAIVAAVLAVTLIVSLRRDVRRWLHAQQPDAGRDHHLGRLHRRRRDRRDREHPSAHRGRHVARRRRCRASARSRAPC